MKPDVKKIIADIKATKGNRKYCNGLAGTLQDDNYVSSICKYVKTVTPERIDLLIDYVENLEVKVLDTAEQLANAESKCRELAAENAVLKDGVNKAIEDIQCFYDSYGWHVSEDGESETAVVALDDAKGSIEHFALSVKTPMTDVFLAEVRAQSASELIAAFSKHVSASCLSDSSVVTIRECEDAMQHVAAQLRKGAAHE